MSLRNFGVSPQRNEEMRKEWRRHRDQWETARITDAQFVLQSEAIGKHYGVLARETVRRDFAEAWRALPPLALRPKPECKR
jgi:hypothetical protein